MIASDTVAVEPRPMIGPLIQFLSSIETEQEENREGNKKTEEIDKGIKFVEREREREISEV